MNHFRLRLGLAGLALLIGGHLPLQLQVWAEDAPKQAGSDRRVPLENLSSGHAVGAVHIAALETRRFVIATGARFRVLEWAAARAIAMALWP